jgi:alkanesulfonate monooxygenase SsuD/methylene tetrahydromethanopterin reductase-like flavin-dependent oxidoreductase (luciferase family)
MSGGRLELGVGRGFVAHDYEKLGIPVDEGQERTVEALDVILKAWSREPFSHHGKYYDYDNIEVWPFPEQEPRPPVWMAATTNPSSFETVGALGLDLLTVAYLRPLTDLAASVDLFRAGLRNAGHGEAGRRIGIHYQVVISEDGAEARRIAKEALDRYAQQLMALHAKAAVPVAPRPELRKVAEGLTIERAVDEGRILAGTPDDCVRVIEQAREIVGITNVDCTFTFGSIDLETAERSMRLFATDVIPRLREPTLV